MRKKLAYWYTSVLFFASMTIAPILLAQPSGEDLLTAHINQAEALVRSQVRNHALTPDQFDALVSFTENLGAVKARPILRAANQGQFGEVATAIKNSAVIYYHDMQGQLVKTAVTLLALTARRADEAAAFDASTPTQIKTQLDKIDVESQNQHLHILLPADLELARRSGMRMEILQPLLAACNTEAQTQQSIYFCAYRDFVAADMSLKNTLMNRAPKRVSASTVALTAWQVRRDQGCEHYAVADFAEGSFEPTAKLLCLTRATQLQTVELQNNKAD